MNRELIYTFIILLIMPNYSCQQQCTQPREDLNGNISLSYGTMALTSIDSHNAKITRNGNKIQLFIQGNAGIPPYLGNTTTPYTSFSLTGELNGEKAQELDANLSYTQETGNKTEQNFSEKVHLKITAYDLSFDKSIHIQASIQGLAHEDNKAITGSFTLNSNNCQVFPIQ